MYFRVIQARDPSWARVKKGIKCDTKVEIWPQMTSLTSNELGLDWSKLSLDAIKETEIVGTQSSYNQIKKQNILF